MKAHETRKASNAPNDDAATDLIRALELLETRDRELEAAQDQLRRARQEREAFFEWLPHAYLETDDTGIVVATNNASEALLGQPSRLLLGKPLSALVAPNSRPAVREAIRAVLRDGAARQLDLDLSFGGEGHVPVVAHVRRDSGRSRADRLCWLLRSVMDDRQARLELRTLNEELERRVAERTGELDKVRARLSAVLHHIPLGVAMTDAEGRIVAANPAAYTILGTETIQTGTRPFSEVPAYRPDASRYDARERPITRSLRNNEVVVGERLEYDVGRTGRVSVEVNTAPIRGADGELTGGVIVFRDVGEVGRRERAMHEFVVNAAHEMRTPVAAIAAALDVLEAGAKDEHEERERFLGHLRNATERLTSLTHALLLLARIESGREETPVEIVPLAPLLTGLAATVQPRPALTVELSCPEDLVALTSGRLLRQALSAVVDNAVRYTTAGSVRLSAEPLGEDRVAITVADTGRGMDPATLEAATTRFFRGPDGHGVGVGLSIAERAVEAAGGSIELASEPGVGTTVTFTVPAGRIISA